MNWKTSTCAGAFHGDVAWCSCRVPSPCCCRFELQYFPLEREKHGSQIWRTASNSILAARPVSTYTVQELPYHTPFQFRIRAHSPFGWSEFSAVTPAFATTAAPPDPIPAPPVAEVLPGGTVHLTWGSSPEDNGATVEGYNVRGQSVIHE